MERITEQISIVTATHPFAASAQLTREAGRVRFGVALVGQTVAIVIFAVTSLVPDLLVGNALNLSHHAVLAT